MTAYERYDYNPNGEVISVRPELPQNVWANQVFAFINVLHQEMARFEELRQQDGDLSLDDGSTYVEGYEDAAEHLRNRFLEIFDVAETPIRP